MALHEDTRIDILQVSRRLSQYGGVYDIVKRRWSLITQFEALDDFIFQLSQLVHLQLIK
jgi:hypothetical protein